MTEKDKAFTVEDHIRNILNYSSEDLFSEVEWHSTLKYYKLKNCPSRQIEQSGIENSRFYKSVDDYVFPKKLIELIIHFLYLQIVFDLKTDNAKNDHINPVINKLKSKSTDFMKVLNIVDNVDTMFSDKNFILLNLLNVSTEIKKIIPLLVSKEIYEKQKIKFKDDNKKYLNIIIVEAHNILSYSSIRESETWKDYRLETFEEIIKEGRKFGVFLTLASQRPSDISSTVISQLHNYFLHRLINNNDITAIERTVSYIDKVSFGSIPILPTGTCILAGQSVSVPIIIEINKICKECEPHNKTIKPTDYWI